MKRISIIFLCAGIAVLSLSSFVCAATNAQTCIAYCTLNPSDYQNFVKNWDDTKQPVLYAVVRSIDQWNGIFHPAPVMGGNRRFAPDADMFATNEILIVARVMPATESADTFRVEQVSTNAAGLVLNYRYTPTPNAVSYTVKNYLGVIVPTFGHSTVAFVENGKQIGTLDAAKGRWCVGPDKDAHKQ